MPLPRRKEPSVADFFVKGDTLPALTTTPVNTLRPTVAALKAALTAFNSTSYSTARMHTMSYNDLVYAARLHSLSVVGL